MIDPGFFDLPAEAYPFTVEFLDATTFGPVWSATVTAPGLMRIPAARELNGGAPVITRITFADGDVRECPPPPCNAGRQLAHRVLPGWLEPCPETGTEPLGIIGLGEAPMLLCKKHMSEMVAMGVTSSGGSLN
jgi:hypothetical protein